MSESSRDLKICPWCLAHARGCKCQECNSTLIDASDADLEEKFRFSRNFLSVRYRVVKYLGKGGMGEVYKAYDRSSDQMVAIKFLLPELASDPVILSSCYDRFTTECQILARLKSPYIVSFVDHEQAPDGTPALVMELLNGHTLQDLLDREKHLDLSQIVDIAVPICRALQAAHERGYVHRDLKPANIFLHDRGDGSHVVKVVDFGIAKVLENSSPNTILSAGPIGTHVYMSPEQCSNRKMTHKSDLFSLGTMLYQMASGRLPFRGRTVYEIWDAIIKQDKAPFDDRLKVPQALECLIDSLLQKDPEKRPANAEEVERLLLEACMEQPADTVRLTSEDMLWLSGDRGKTRAQTYPDVYQGLGKVTPPSNIPAGETTNAQDRLIERPGIVETVSRKPKAPVSLQTASDDSSGGAAGVEDLVVSSDDGERFAKVLASSRRPTSKWKIAGGIAGIFVVTILFWVVYAAATSTSVSAIRNDCSAKAFDEVKVSATVVTSVSIPLTEVTGYKISDGDSSIWVLSSVGAPRDDASVSLKGIVVEAQAWDYICKQDDPPEDCELVAGAMKVVGNCLILETER